METTDKLEKNVDVDKELDKTPQTDSRKKLKKKNTRKTILDIVVYILIIGVIVFGVPKFLVWYLDTPTPMAAITSSSMWPTLKEGDLVFIEGVSREEIEVDDIVVFQNRVNGTLTIHRVVKLGDEKITTKGDANFSEDAPVDYTDVAGRAVILRGKPIRVPFLGTVTMLVNQSKENEETQPKNTFK